MTGVASRKSVAGPHQYVCRVRHPQRGDGVAVYRHGPSFFQPDGASPIAMRVRAGGYRAGLGPFVVLDDPDHGRVEAKELERGERHDRMWSPLLGLGWLVNERTDAWSFRFEGDDGRVTRFNVNHLAVGTTDYNLRQNRTRSRVIEMTPEEERWLTYGLTDGTSLALRKDGAPPPADAPAPADLVLPGVAFDAAPKRKRRKR
jgi:hypothetical protein